MQWTWVLLLVQLVRSSLAARCSFVDEKNSGWLCNDGKTCLPESWICDGEVQCPLPDQSDEKEGCNLYPKTGCKSWYGEKHTKCPDGRCVQSTTDCDTTESSTDPGTDKTCPGEAFEQWRCRSGRCIPKKLVCNGKTDCPDGSDEDQGCNLFPDTDCKSWLGKRHVRCNGNDTTCTLPQFLGNCRQCLKQDFWRCDDGFCIPLVKVEDGLRDCFDGSDESAESWKWWNVFLITVSVASLGLLLSFLYRFFRTKKNVFDCVLCRSQKSSKAAFLEMDMLDSDTAHRLPDNTLPYELIDIFEKDDSWRKMSIQSQNWNCAKSLAAGKEERGQRLYAKIHSHPVLYKNLYRYLLYRYSTPKLRSGCIEELFRWEKDFHGQNNFEVLACWRLHLGSCDTLRQVIKAVQPETFVTKFYDFYVPKKNEVRKMLRNQVPKNSRVPFNCLYNLWNTLWYLIKPFMGISFFYFDLLKDLAFTILIFHAVQDLTKGHLTITDYPFEFCVVVGLFLSIIMTQIFFVFISVSYCDDVFEMCEHNSSGIKKTIFKVISFIAAPLMPAFLLANFVFYVQKEYGLKRELETLSKQDDHWPKKMSLFKDIEEMRHMSNLHRRIYSFFRISAAVVQSFNMIVGIIVIVVVSKQPDRNTIPLIDGVTQKIGDFLNIGQEETFLDNMDVAMDTVVIFCVLYSTMAILSALLRYVYQSKSLNLVLGGKICLVFYFMCHLASRLTIFIALFSTAESSDSTHSPNIPLLPAGILGILIFIVHFILIFWFKTKYVIGFKDEPLVCRLIHVLANTLVVIPYCTWDVDPPETDNCPPFCPKRTKSLPSQPRKPSPKFQKANSEIQMSSFIFPNVSAPLVYEVGDVKDEIIELWWQDPRRDLTKEMIRDHLKSVGKLQEDHIIERDLNTLEVKGLINKKLYIPQRTKREYFWLFVLHLLFSSLALIIEFVNGGTYTMQGVYYSWDVRLASFVLGIVFLLMYYKRYHVMHDLMTGSTFCNVNVCKVLCCCSEQVPLHAVPDYEILERYQTAPPPPPSSHNQPPYNPNVAQTDTIDVMTQTSIIEKP